jgi:hypothetical protein
MQTTQRRAVLNSNQARDIFRAKEPPGNESLYMISNRLATQYQVSSKTIRDIWKGRSWLHATFDLWDAEDRPCCKIVGRPKGKKDSMPRQSKSVVIPSIANSNNDGYTRWIGNADILCAGRRIENTGSLSVQTGVSLPPIRSLNDTFSSEQVSEVECNLHPRLAPISSFPDAPTVNQDPDYHNLRWNEFLSHPRYFSAAPAFYRDSFYSNQQATMPLSTLISLPTHHWNQIESFQVAGRRLIPVSSQSVFHSLFQCLL